MKVLNEWTDDHLPCVSFEHNGRMFEVWWTGRDMAGKLELVEDGDITLEKALKKYYPQTLKVVNNPDLDDSDAEIEFELYDDGKKSYFTESCVYVYPIGHSVEDKDDQE